MPLAWLTLEDGIIMSWDEQPICSEMILSVTELKERTNKAQAF